MVALPASFTTGTSPLEPDGLHVVPLPRGRRYEPALPQVAEPLRDIGQGLDPYLAPSALGPDDAADRDQRSPSPGADAPARGAVASAVSPIRTLPGAVRL